MDQIIYRQLNKISFLLLIAYASQADAAAITNLSSAAQTIEIMHSEGFVPLSIAANETLRVPGKIVVRYKSHEVHMESDEEFAIWNDGSFGPQKRLTFDGSKM